ncbi:EAL domain-containing protein [Wenzhouxiangella limi]|uniref:EAL domain-containing protein n=1 Tax=Wenzhouxiangella limi TaxID=2707351 RepID=A0A845UVB5_9GAMM|nr:EAL domain-containing protein [Wenzhouxiangella limi]NDY95427.1 EAL domain-containing protein [Wenzhouxiangella limi]
MIRKKAAAGCARCIDAPPFPISLSMAFQPIVKLSTGEIFAHEALVRGASGESAGEVFSHVTDDNLYLFDQTCRVKAIEEAARIGIATNISINFMPNAVYQAETCIQRTLQAAAEFDFPLDKIIFEVTETDAIPDRAHLRNILDYYKQRGFRTAIDDFGEGYAGLNLLSEFIPDLVKLDMALIRAIDQNPAQRKIVEHMIRLCRDLGSEVIAEGVETMAERDVLRALGVDLFQGYLFARPAFQSAGTVDPASLAG